MKVGRIDRIVIVCLLPCLRPNPFSSLNYVMYVTAGADI